LCVTGIPRPAIGLPGGPIFTIGALLCFDWYWVSLATAVGTGALYHALTTFRLERAFHAVRDDEGLAGAAGINPLKYRMLAFVISAAVAGGVGALYASYVQVLCPGELTIAL